MNERELNRSIVLALIYFFVREGFKGKSTVSFMFEQNLRKWAILDNKIRASNAELKEMRNQRDQLSSTICNTMKTNGWQDKKINTGDSIITYCEKNETSTIKLFKSGKQYIMKRLRSHLPTWKNV